MFGVVTSVIALLACRLKAIFLSRVITSLDTLVPSRCTASSQSHTFASLLHALHYARPR